MQHRHRTLHGDGRYDSSAWVVPGTITVTVLLAGATALVERGAESPSFVFPLRRDGGHFMLFSQFAPAHRMFVMTFLEDYRKNPELAQPWASVHLFDELVVSKGVGLLRAEVTAERLTDAEAAHLLLLVQRYYATSNYDKVWMFNHAEKHFDVEGYLAACP